MKSIKWWMVVLAIWSLAAGFSVPLALGETATVDGVTWIYTVEGGNATVTGSTPATGILTIPSELGGYPVAIVGYRAFLNTTITVLTIPDSVKNIEESAFENCSKLQAVTIGNSVTNIGKRAFVDNGVLSSLTIGKNVVYIEGEAFENCIKLRTLKLPDGVMGIGEQAFHNCSGLASVTIPDSVASIGDYAFYGCNGLASITIGNGVRRIGYFAFGHCSNLSVVHIHDLAAWFGIEFVSSAANPLDYAHHLYLDGEEVVNLTIPDSVTSIGDYAFEECSGLTSVTIGNSVTSIGGCAFVGCNGLTNVMIGNSVTSIGSDAFSSCSGLTGVTIPDSVTSIGNSAFYNCNGLTSVTIPDSVTSIEYGAFCNCNGLTSLTILGNVTNDWSSGLCPFTTSANISTLVLGEKMTKIGSYMFSGCSGLTSVTVPDSVASIGNCAFRDCSGLTSVTIPDSVTSIGEYAFYGCDSLSALYVPESWKSKYVDGEFWSEHARVPEGCTVVYEDSFQSQLALAANSRTFTADATNSKELGVTANVPWAAESSAAWLTLKTASGNGNGTIVYDVAANGGTRARTGTITVTGGGLTRTFMVIQEGTASGGGGEDVTWSYTISNGVATVTGAEPAEGDLVIPGTLGGYPVTCIGIKAFYGCSNLTSVTIPSGVTNFLRSYDYTWAWGVINTFSGCSGLTDVHVSEDNAVYASKDGVLFTKDGKTLLLCPPGKTGAYSVPDDVRQIGDCLVHVGGIDMDVAHGGWCAFSGCTKLAEVTLPEGLRAIDDGAFEGCSGLTTMTIPDSVTNIGNCAFYACSGLKSVSIGNDTESIGEMAFDGCSGLTDVHVSKDNPVYASKDGVLFTKDGKTLLFCPASKTGAYSVPDGVRQIGDGLVHIGMYVAHGGWFAFSGCTKLTNVTIPDGVKVIDDGAFEGCSGLTTMAIPDSVADIGNCAFSACGGLKTISIGNGAKYIGEQAFYGCSGLETISIGYGVTNIGYGAFSACSGLTSVTIPDSVTSIGSAAFSGCSSLTSVSIPESVTSIGSYAFRNCSGLKTLYAPESWKTKYVYGEFWSDYADVPSGCEIIYGAPPEAPKTSTGVSYAWLEEHGLGDGTAEGYEAAAAADAANVAYKVWECYVAGLDPTDPAARFTAVIGFTNGTPVVSWTPDLNEKGTQSARSYVLEGTTTLTNAWGPTNAASRFFRVRATLP